MSEPTPRLGAYQLGRPLGSGGMGTVWEAVHLLTGRPAAVKVLSPEHTRSARLRAAFRTEVRAAASLDHPHVIGLYDHGSVDDAAVEASGGRLALRAPWLAMEHAERGDLVRYCGRLDVPEVVGVLRALLDALAHAHARRVLHRDLKPSNVVAGGLRPGIKLTDFGLADLDVGDRPGGGGTPAYMAPEQLSHRWRTFGPWTDLFALGCLGWALLTGEPPFGHQTPDVVRRQSGPLPTLPSDDLEPLQRWLHTLLQVDAKRRYQSAPGAARALVQLSTTLPRETQMTSSALLDVPTVQALPTLDWFVTDQTGSQPDTERPGGSAAGVRRRQRVPVPLSWGSGPPLSRRNLLPGVGLSLVRLRPPPMVGRHQERDALWSALRGVVRRKRAGAVVLSGTAGSGKSRLARWLCERSHELAAATVLQTGHTPTGGPSDGLPAMLRHRLRAEGLGGAALRAHLVSRLGTGEGELAAACATLLDPDHDHGFSLEQDRERNRVVTSAIDAVALGAPCVVWLDDAHWGPEAIAWASSVLREVDERRLLVVLTVRDDLLRELPQASAALDALYQAGAERVEVDLLEDAVTLIRDALGLEGDLAARIAESTGGVPLFAVQLVEDWLDRGLLGPGERGFRLVADDTLSLPPTLDGVWLARIDGVLATLPVAAGRAVERAAVLGARVDMAEWREASAGLDVSLSELSDVLADHRLIVALDDRDGFRWVHGLLRESLMARVHAEGRTVEHHMACATAVESSSSINREARLGRHLLAAGRIHDAIGPLLAGAYAAQRSGEFGQTAALLQTWQRAMEEGGVPRTDVRWADGLLLRAEGASMVDEATIERIDEAMDAATIGGHYRQQARALWIRGTYLLDHGQLNEAIRDLESADVLAAPWPALRVRIRSVQATAARSQGDLSTAGKRLDEAVGLLDHTDGQQTGNVYVQVGLLADARGQYDAGDAAFDIALRAFRTRGIRRGIAHALNGKAEIARHRGEPEVAVTLYQDALRAYERIGGYESLYVRANLAMVELERGSYGMAAAVLGAGLPEAEHMGQTWLISVMHVLLTAAYAGTSAYISAQRHLDAATELLRESGAVDRDLAWCLDLAANLAIDAGKSEFAARCRELEARQRAILDLQD